MFVFTYVPVKQIVYSICIVFPILKKKILFKKGLEVIQIKYLKNVIQPFFEQKQ